MPITTRWLADTHTLEYRLDGVITRADLQWAVQIGQDLAQAGPAPVNILVNCTTLLKSPSDALVYLLEAGPHGTAALVSAPTSSAMIEAILAHGQVKQRLPTYATRHAALAALRQSTARAELFMH